MYLQLTPRALESVHLAMVGGGVGCLVNVPGGCMYSNSPNRAAAADKGRGEAGGGQSQASGWGGLRGISSQQHPAKPHGTSGSGSKRHTEASSKYLQANQEPYAFALRLRGRPHRL